MVPAGWQNPITQPAGQVQTSVDPLLLLPTRSDLQKVRLDVQRGLLLAGTPRWSPIRVTLDGMIYDGHHAVRAAAEEGKTVEILVVDQPATVSAPSILHLPVR
jgi:hypothetical protein